MIPVNVAIVIALGLLAAIMLPLAAWHYDRKIAALEASGHHHGYVSLLVAAGCSAILGAAIIVCWPLGPAARIAVAITAGLFVPPGCIMIHGSIRRHVTARQTEAERLTAEAREALR